MISVDAIDPVSILNDPNRISMSAVGQRLGVSRQSPFRWASKGVLLSDGRRIKLAAARLGSRWYTSTAAIEHFVAATSSTPGTDRATPTPTPAQQRRAAEADSRELDRLGIK